MKKFSFPYSQDSETAEGGQAGASSILAAVEVKDSAARAVFELSIQEQPGFRIHNLSDQADPHIRILEINPDPHRAKAFIQFLQSSDPACDIFLTGACPDSPVLLEALRAGIIEFLPYPVNQQHVRHALVRYARVRHGAQRGDLPRSGHIRSVMGSSGGLGTTSVAVNLAVSLKTREPSKSVVLVEVDQQSGNLPLYVDLSPAYTFQDITNDLPRLDDALVRKFLIEHHSGIHILASGSDNLHPGRLDSLGIKPAMILLASLFDYIVVDVGHILEAPANEALALSDLIMLVTTLQVPVIRRTHTVLQTFQKNGFGAKVEIIVNRYRDEEAPLIEETESILQHRLRWRIPEDARNARHAVNQGTPCVLLNPKSSIAKGFLAMADGVSGKVMEQRGFPKSRSPINKLLQYGLAKLQLAKAS